VIIITRNSVCVAKRVHSHLATYITLLPGQCLAGLINKLKQVRCVVSATRWRNPPTDLVWNAC